MRSVNRENTYSARNGDWSGMTDRFAYRYWVYLRLPALILPYLTYLHTLQTYFNRTISVLSTYFSSTLGMRWGGGDGTVWGYCYTHSQFLARFVRASRMAYQMNSIRKAFLVCEPIRSHKNLMLPTSFRPTKNLLSDFTAALNRGASSWALILGTPNNTSETTLSVQRIKLYREKRKTWFVL